METMIAAGETQMRIFRLFALLGAAALFLSCSASPSIYLAKDGGGRCEFRLSMEKPFVDYLLDLGEAGGMFPSREKAVIFDLPIIEKQLKKYEGVTVTRLRAVSAGELELSFDFKNVAVFTKAGALSPQGGLLSITGGDKKSIRLRLDKSTVNQILTSFIKVKGSEVEYFLPRQGETKQDYYDNLDFALDSGSALFRKSAITFLVTVEGAIVEHNGALKSPSSVQFTVPLETVLFFDKPLEYFVVYQ
jgi:hypothetical protein